MVENVMNAAEQELFDKIWRFQGGKEEFIRMRKEAIAEYNKLTEEEQEVIDESMIMEHLSMMYSCYVED